MDAVAVRAMLTRMQMTNDAAAYVTDEQGMRINSLLRLRDFHTDDDLDGFAKNLRTPGGTVDDGQGNQVRHPGFSVSVIAISNLKVVRLALKHFQKIQRTVVPGNIDEAFVARWEFLVDFKAETDKKKPRDDELPKLKMDDWPKNKEKIVDYFADVYGRDGIPLGRIIREEVAVKPEAEDPRTNYGDDHVKELIVRSPHQGGSFPADNRTVCRLFKLMCVDTPAYEHISKYTANGRQCWLDLKAHYLGPQHTQNQAAIWEARLNNLTYEGETRNFGIHKYNDVHKQGETILLGLMPGGYSGMDQGTHIRHYLNGIKVDKLKTVVELLRGNPQYTTLDAVARRVMDSVVVEKPTRPGRQIGSMTLKDNKGDEIFPGVEADMSMEDKFYQPREWAAMSKAKKKGVLLKRRARGPKSKEKKGEKKTRKRLAKVERAIASLTLNGNQETSEGAEEPPKKKPNTSTGNRDHPDLQRQNGGRR